MVMTTDRLDIGPGEKLVWESVITNSGGGFFPETAEFICPEDGLYFFSMTAITTNSYENIRADVQLMHGSEVLVSSSAYAHLGWGSTTQSAVIECSNGQRVWVRCRPDITVCNLQGTTGYHFTSFSGFKIGV